MFLWCLLLLPALLCADEEKIELPGGKVLTVFVQYPSEVANEPPPLAIMLPGSKGDGKAVRWAARQLGGPLSSRGFMVAIPLSADGKNFYGDEANDIVGLAKVLAQREKVAKKPILIGGISNGGIAAMKVASLSPQSFCGVIAVPGVLWKDTNLEKLRNMPVYLRIGENDFLGWGKEYQRIAAQLVQHGVRLDGKMLEGQPHVFGLNWEELDNWMKKNGVPTRGVQNAK